MSDVTHATNDIVTKDLEKILALVDRARLAGVIRHELIYRDVVRAVQRFEAQHGGNAIDLILEALP